MFNSIAEPVFHYLLLSLTTFNLITSYYILKPISFNLIIIMKHSSNTEMKFKRVFGSITKFKNIYISGFLSEILDTIQTPPPPDFAPELWFKNQIFYHISHNHFKSIHLNSRWRQTHLNNVKQNTRDQVLR